jgi:stress-induced morphogen
MDHAISIDEVRRRIEQALPGARVEVATFSGHDHFQAVVEAPQFAGKSRVEQHQMVYAAVSDLIGGAMHALALKTRPPESEPDKEKP